MALGGVAAPNSDLDVLDAALDDCHAVPLSCLSPQEISDRLARLQSLTAKLASLRVDAVAAGRLVGRATSACCPINATSPTM